MMFPNYASEAELVSGHVFELEDLNKIFVITSEEFMLPSGIFRQ
jgi:hypothetical protein